MVNFAECNKTFIEGLDAQNQTIIGYRYDGPIGTLYAGRSHPPMITYEGCVALCGSGPDYYDWATASATICTWVLPIVGPLLQAPYESHEFWDTIKTLIHWVGSSMSSIAAVFWNIEVCNRCSLIVDMAISQYISTNTALEMHYKDIRDAFYLLSVINQYVLDKTFDRGIAEKLLRTALFSDTLELLTDDGKATCIVKYRARLAEQARMNRKRGVVPVLISLGLFVLAFAISVQQAFGQLGFAAQAHNLGLGFILAWLPIFIVSCIVDRNPTQAQAMRAQLNEFIEDVRMTLLDEESRQKYIHSTGRKKSSFKWIEGLQIISTRGPNPTFLSHFAGQGRLQWHYGIAHDILDGVEESYVQQHGRGWLEDPETARQHLVVGPDRASEDSARKLNPKSLWQLICAVFLVSVSCLGAGIVSYSTPPQGLGCRSGGYLIFYVLTLFTLILELIIWAVVPKDSIVGVRRLTIVATKVSRYAYDDVRAWFDRTTARDYLKYGLFLIELANTIWMFWIAVAQIFGVHRSCECEARLYDRNIDYLDFSASESYLDFGIESSWITSIVIVIVAMTIHFIYVVHEWCTQSHLSSLDYQKSQRGLQRTRWYRSKILWFQKIVWFMSSKLTFCWLKLLGNAFEQRSKPLRWTSAAGVYSSDIELTAETKADDKSEERVLQSSKHTEEVKSPFSNPWAQQGSSGPSVASSSGGSTLES